MIKHIVAWNYGDGFSDSENRENAKKIKEGLEALNGVIAGIVEIEVHIDLLPSGNRDIVLYSVFESMELLDAYQVHPEHRLVSSFIGSVMQNRVCVDYAI